jgi:hypothetical protein
MTTINNEDEKLYVEKDLYLPKIKEEYKTFLNKSINLYGSSNSQKSTIIIQIMHILKNHVPSCICFNMTENSNNTFKKLLPDALIHTTLEIATLESIWKRQETLTEIYKKVNNIDNIKELIHLFEESHSFENNISKIQNKKNEEVELLNTKKLDKNILILEKNKINDKFNEIEIILTKKYIHNIKDKIKNISNCLKKGKGLSKEEEDYYFKYKNLDDDKKIIIKYNDINPHLLIIFDDCAASIKPITKTDIIRKLFYQSRHNNITFICAAQDEIDLDASLRKNARMTILCDSNCAAGFFERTSNAFGKPLKLLTRKIINKLFIAEHKYKKLVYNKDSINQLEWIEATVIEPFSFCSENVLEFIKSVSKTNENSLSKLIQKI